MPKKNHKDTTVTLPITADPPPNFPPPASVRIATLGGVGNIPWAPGTFGSMLAVACIVLFDRIPFTPAFRAPLLCLAVGLIFGIGVAVSRVSEVFLRQRDPAQVVIDEFAGQLLAFIFEPFEDWRLLLAGFVAFRLFDIWKPFPARQAERMHGGWGIMLDDVVAGLYALIVVVALRYVLP